MLFPEFQVDFVLPVIQRASERALKQGTCLSEVLTLAAEIRQFAQSTGLIVFTYLNPILRMGMDKFCKIARHAGVDLIPEMRALLQSLG